MDHAFNSSALMLDHVTLGRMNAIIIEDAINAANKTGDVIDRAGQLAIDLPRQL